MKRFVLVLSAVAMLALASTAVADYANSPGAARYVKKSHKCGNGPPFSVTVFDLRAHATSCGKAYAAMNSDKGRRTIGFSHRMKLKGGFSCKFHKEYFEGRRNYNHGWYLCRNGGGFFIFRPYDDSGL